MPGWLKFQILGLVMVACFGQVDPTLACGIWIFFLSIGGLQLITWILRGCVMPGIQAIGDGAKNLAVDLIDIVVGLYSITLLPLIKLICFLVRLPARLKEGNSRKSAPGSRWASQSHGDENDGEDDDNDDEDTYHWRQAQRNQHQSAQAPHQASEPYQRPWHDVLGVAPDADFDTVKQAYYARAKEYHPDSVSHLGPKLRALAEQELKETNEAWELFQRQRRSLGPG